MVTTNHKLHLILTILTLGLWGIVWLIIALSNRNHNIKFEKSQFEAGEAFKEDQRQKTLEKEINQKKLVLDEAIKNNTIDATDAKVIAQIEKNEERIKQLSEASLNKESEVTYNKDSGYIYVISNEGSFGCGIIKIGLTRRETYERRIKELSSASVPFKFNKNLIFYSEDASSVEKHLHKIFADRRVNKANKRKEFFYAEPEEVKEVLENSEGILVYFDPETNDTEFLKTKEIENSSEED